MSFDCYKRPFFVILVFYIIFIIVFSNLLIENNDKDITNNRLVLCGNAISYPSKSGYTYYFYIKSNDKKYLAISKKEIDIVLYQKICFYGRIDKVNADQGYFKKNGVYYRFYIEEIRKVYKPNVFLELSSNIRNRIKKYISSHFTADETTVISGIFLGEKQDISKKFKKAVIDAGVMHVLVASGSNVSYVVLMIFFILNVFLRSDIAKFLAMILTSFYVFIIGFEPPITRAYLMLLIGWLSLNIERNVDLFQIMIISAFFMLVVNPLLIYDVSFLMSFFSLYGIICGWINYSRYIEFKRRTYFTDFLRWILSIFLITFFAQISLSPILVLIFHKLSIVSLLSNIIIIPLSSFMIWLISVGFAFSNLGLLNNIFLFLIKLSSQVFIKTVYFFSSFKFSSLYISFPNNIFLIFFIVFIFIVLHLPIIDLKKATNRSILFFIIVFLFVSSLWRKVEYKNIELTNKNNLSSFLFFHNQELYIIDPVISFDRIINAVYNTNYNNIDYILITARSKMNMSIINEIEKFFNIKNKFAPLWLCRPGFICVYPGEEYNDFKVRFKNRYGYFNSHCLVEYCFEDKCY